MTKGHKAKRKLVRHTHEGMRCGACFQPLVRGALVAEQGGRRYHTTCAVPEKNLTDQLNAQMPGALRRR